MSPSRQTSRLPGGRASTSTSTSLSLVLVPVLVPEPALVLALYSYSPGARDPWMPAKGIDPRWLGVPALAWWRALRPLHGRALRRGEDSGGLGRPGLAAWIAPGGGVLRGRPPRPRQGGVPRPRAVPDHGERGVREGGLLGGVGRLLRLLALRGPRAAGRMPHPPLPREAREVPREAREGVRPRRQVAAPPGLRPRQAPRG